jgi:hypothetical protein
VAAKKVYCYHGQHEEPGLWEEGVEVLVEKEGDRGEQRRVHVVDFTLAHVRHLHNISKITDEI